MGKKGSIVCRELPGLPNQAGDPVSEARMSGYYKNVHAWGL